MRLNPILPVCLSLGLAAGGLASDTPGKPAAEPLARYQAMVDHSPFALATENVSGAAATPAAGFAKDLVLTGAVHLTNGDYVTVTSRDQSQSFSLRTGMNYSGISLVNVAWSEGVGKTRATLKCGTEFATIAFDEANLQAKPSQPSHAANGGKNTPDAKFPVPPVPTAAAPRSRRNRIMRPTPIPTPAPS